MAFRSNITRLIEAHGSNEERQLIARWRREIDEFLGTFGADLVGRKSLLAFELSANLELGLTVIGTSRARQPSMAMRARQWLPEPARSVAEDAIAANVDCQVSQCLLPASCRYTLRVRNRSFSGFTAPSQNAHPDNSPPPTLVHPGFAIQSHYGCPPAPFPPQAIHSWLLSDDISFWLSAMHHTQLMQQLRETTHRLETRFRASLVPHVAELLEHYTLINGTTWGPVRCGVVLRDVPADLATRLLSGSSMKRFRYLATYRPYKSVALVLDRSEQVERFILVP